MHGRVLHAASNTGDVYTMRRALHAGVDVDSKDFDGATALNRAAIHGNEIVLRVLLEARASLDSKDGDGVTTLMDASINGHMDAVRALLEAGAMGCDGQRHDGVWRRNLYGALRRCACFS